MKKKIKNRQPQTKFTGSYKKKECNEDCKKYNSCER